MTFRTSLLNVGAGAIALASALSVGSQAHAALAIEPLFIPGINTISDNDAELFVNKVGGATTVDVGDIFLGAIEIDSINNVAIGSGTLFNEFTGVFGVRVTSVTPVGGGLAFFTFGAVVDLRGEFLAATLVDVGPTPAGTFAKLWEDPAQNATRDLGSFASFVSETSGGTFRLRLETDDNDIQATGLADLALLAFFPPGSGVPISFFDEPGADGPTVVENTFSFDIVGPVGVSGNAQKPVPPEDFTIRTDTTFTATVVVPEPATLAVLGVGLLGLGLVRRRRNRA